MGKFKKDVGVIVRKGRVSFRVWAPFATGVGVAGVFNGWLPTPMRSEGDGYWFLEVALAEPGQEYKFVIDTPGGQLYKNDPRALHLTPTRAILSLPTTILIGRMMVSL